MEIHGFQKLTALDFPGKIACTVFTAGCNLRCPFCHNARLVTHPESDDAVPEREILAYLQKRRGLLDGVCITGGEPLLSPDIADFIAKIKDMGYAVKLDTNGFFPEKLRALLEKNLLDYIAMDIKNSPELYEKTVGVRADISAVKESIELIKTLSPDYEFRTTVVRELHTIESLRAAAKLISGAKIYFLQAFKDSGDIIGEGLSTPEKEFMENAQSECSKFVEKVELRGV